MKAILASLALTGLAIVVGVLLACLAAVGELFKK